MRPLTPSLLLLLTACDPFANWPDTDHLSTDRALWDDDVVAAADGMYVMLPRAGELVRVQDDGSYEVVDLDGLQPSRIEPDPTGQRVVVFGTWPSCDDDDPKIRHVSECPYDELQWNPELAIVEDGKRIGAAEMPSHMNDIVFSPDGRVAVAFHNEDKGAITETQGIVDLTQVIFIPLDTGEATSVSIGFNPSDILFTDDGSAAVVMSRSQVVVVDLDTFTKTTAYPLTLDPDQSVEPADAVLTPDGDYALVAIEGASELYVLDLANPSITIETLESPPADLAVYQDPNDDSDPGVTLVVYSDRASFDMLANDNAFNLEDSIELDDPVTRILEGDDFALLYNDSGRSLYDVYRYDFAAGDLVEYVVDNPVESMQLSESGEWAVGVLTPEPGAGTGIDSYQDANWGLAVLDMSSDEAISLVVEAEPVGVELVENEDGAFALVLMDGVDQLYTVNLAQPGAATALDLPAPPTGIGTLPDGRFYITHQSSLGLISFLDPATGDLTEASGFATPSLFTDDTLPRRGEENQ